MTAGQAGRFYVVAMAIGLAPFACRSTTERDRVDFERMRSQQRYAEYGASKVFPDGMSMRTLSAGTISREEYELGEAVTTGKSNGAFVASSPVPVTPSVLEQGAQTYRIYCAVCHGEDGATQTVLGSNMWPVHPPSLRTPSARARSAARPARPEWSRRSRRCGTAPRRRAPRAASP